MGHLRGQLRYVPQRRRAGAAPRPSAEAELELGDDARRLHYLSVPPKAALAVVTMLEERRPGRAVAGW